MSGFSDWMSRSISAASSFVYQPFRVGHHCWKPGVQYPPFYPLCRPHRARGLSARLHRELTSEPSTSLAAGAAFQNLESFVHKAPFNVQGRKHRDRIVGGSEKQSIFLATTDNFIRVIRIIELDGDG